MLQLADMRVNVKGNILEIPLALKSIEVVEAARVGLKLLIRFSSTNWELGVVTC